MNNKIAFSLVFGFILSVFSAYFTSQTVSEYNSNVIQKGFENREQVRNTLAKEEIIYNPTIILICFAGGFGIGYLVFDRFKPMRNIG